MQLSENERSLIEQALNEAMNHSGSYHAQIQYRQVLTKLQSMPMIQSHSETAAQEDGFRYDYDDSSGLI
ncbi:hypothetical protein SY83_17955 [Paenibacillus swuensis]|uniref:Uncharacterized protein n=1 Tax=Paenibacillus swuensis TaxID=1178515 RepID=A0A172TLK5_9BACL|nr:hypothetical protein [Paenibacillus swuensis]ANE47862.1 hypothetical protein SY83_17955 [Paenibacillus swuensis]